ncbi:hypothetical protein [Staphylococcus nepalensis]|uniref:hypothetical protein n=1 Tax=Staphylococcus nepalensis TaxID=214473 RepID=UPI003CE7C8B4
MNRIHELRLGDDIWFRAYEHNISYPGIVKEVKDEYQKAVIQMGKHIFVIDSTYEIALI